MGAITGARAACHLGGVLPGPYGCAPGGAPTGALVGALLALVALPLLGQGIRPGEHAAHRPASTTTTAARLVWLAIAAALATAPGSTHQSRHGIPSTSPPHPPPQTARCPRCSPPAKPQRSSGSGATSSTRPSPAARYPTLLRDYVRPSLGARPLKQLTPLEVQAIYGRLAVGGRRDGKPGGLAPQHLLAVHRALTQAVTWRLLAHNPASRASPPPVPRTQAVALAPEQVALLLDAADHTTSRWLGPWTVLAAATGARNGELCGLEWADLDLDAGTVRSARPWP